MTSSASSLFQDACWIWPESHNWDLHNSYALFRKAFQLKAVPRQAPLLITADQSYQLFINGEYVCRYPVRGFQRSWPYDEVDVRSHLRAGRNVIAQRAHNPGFSNFQYISQGYAGLLVAARWGSTQIQTDGSWKARRQEGMRRDTVPTSFQLFCQEHVDLRQEDSAWSQVAPAWREISFCPCFWGESNDTVVPTPQGSIHSSWRKTQRRIEVHLSLPDGIKAKPHLPGIGSKMIQGEASWQIAGP